MSRVCLGCCWRDLLRTMERNYKQENVFVRKIRKKRFIMLWWYSNASISIRITLRYTFLWSDSLWGVVRIRARYLAHSNLYSKARRILTVKSLSSKDLCKHSDMEYFTQMVKMKNGNIYKFFNCTPVWKTIRCLTSHPSRAYFRKWKGSQYKINKTKLKHELEKNWTDLMVTSFALNELHLE